VFAEASWFKGLRVAKVMCKKKSATDHSEQGRRFCRPRPALSPRRPAELLSVPLHDRGRRLQPNADATTLVDIRTFVSVATAPRASALDGGLGL